jgi:hypothetical protein
MTSINMTEMSGRRMGEEYVIWASNGKYRLKIDNSRTVFQPANGAARHGSSVAMGTIAIDGQQEGGARWQNLEWRYAAHRAVGIVCGSKYP